MVDIDWPVAVAIGLGFGFALGWSAAFAAVISDHLRAKGRLPRSGRPDPLDR